MTKIAIKYVYYFIFQKKPKHIQWLMIRWFVPISLLLFFSGSNDMWEFYFIWKYSHINLDTKQPTRYRLHSVSMRSLSTDNQLFHLHRKMNFWQKHSFPYNAIHRFDRNALDKTNHIYIVYIFFVLISFHFLFFVWNFSNCAF